MEDPPINAVLVEDNAGDARLVREMLRPVSGLRLHHVDRLDAALEHCGRHEVDIVLLDLGLPDSQGLETLRTLSEAAPHLPVVVLTGTDDDALGQAAVRSGAQDYFAKGRVVEYALQRAIRYAIERHQTRSRVSHLNRVLRAIRGVNQLVVRERDRDRLLAQACALLVDTRGFGGAWIALDGDGGAPACRAEAGWGPAFAPLARELDAGRWPPCRRRAEAAPDGLVLQEPQTSCGECPLGALHRNDRAVVTLLRHAGRTFGMLYVSFPREVPFDEEERQLLLEVAGDLAFALHGTEVEEQRRRAEANLRASEERFRTLVESMDDAVVTVARDGRCTSLRARYLERLGYAVPALVGKTAAEVFGAEAGATHRAAHDRVLAGEHVVYEWSFVARGEVHHMQTSASPLRNPEGRIVGAVHVSRDATETRKLHEQLLLSERMTSMGTLAAGVAHEINNPLAANVANVDFARRELEPLRDRLPNLDEVLDALKDAADSADRVRQIVRDLKVFSRADEQRRDPVDVRLVLESAVRMVWNEIRHRANLKREYGEVPPVLANEARLGQVFLNLLVNAAQAMAEGHADENCIVLAVGTDAVGRVVVEVRDTGCGIAPEVRAHIFEAFYTTKPVGVGTGLGLAICHRIVTELEGEIACESAVGRGTTFRVTLPAATASAVATLPVATPTPRRRRRLLVVDDEAPVGRALGRALGIFHQITVAGSGREALALLQSGARFDLVLCDLMMPEMTGVELHAELTRTWPEMAERTVFMTGGAFTPAAHAFLDRVPNERVEKPVDSRNLLALIERLLR